MKPNFALNLSHTGIALLHRAAAGWHLMGDVSLDSPDMAGELAALRSLATAISSSGLSTKLVIPSSQILYRIIPDPGGSDAVREKAIREALDGTTPYLLSDLVFDWHSGPQGLCVAVVARETLSEAEDFAREHRFNPLSFVAIPESDAFDGEPYFGRTDYADQLIGADTQIERDSDAIVVLGRRAALSPHLDDVVEAPNTMEMTGNDAPAALPASEETLDNATGTAPKDAPKPDATKEDVPAEHPPENDLPETEVVPTGPPVAPSDKGPKDTDQPDKQTKTGQTPTADAAPSAGFLSIRAAFAADRAAEDTLTEVDAENVKRIAARLSNAPSRVLGVAAPKTGAAPSVPSVRGNGASAAKIVDPAPSKSDADDTPEQEHPHVAITAGDLPVEEPPEVKKPAPKLRKSGPLPEPPAMPAMPAPRAIAPDTAEAPSLKQLVQRSQPGEPNVDKRPLSVTDTDPFPLPQGGDAAPTPKRGGALGGIATAKKALLLKKDRAASAGPAPTPDKNTVAKGGAKAAALPLKTGDVAPEPLSDQASGLHINADEPDARTVFGARKLTVPPQGKRRYTGVILTAGLLLLLLVVGLWASLSDDGTDTQSEDIRTSATQTDLDANAAQSTRITTETNAAPVPPAPDGAADVDPDLAAELAGEPDVPATADTDTEATEDLTMAESDLIATDEATLPDLPAGDVPPTLEGAQAAMSLGAVTRFYRDTGIWAMQPDQSRPSGEDVLDDVYIASIDPDILSQDAIALPVPAPHQLDALPRAASEPAPAGTTYDLDADGFVRATAEGALTPDGAVVFAGPPPSVPRARPTNGAAVEAEVALADDPVRLALSTARPTLRPEALIESNERANLGGLTREQLGRYRPRPRPQSAQQDAQLDADIEGQDTTAPVMTVSAFPKIRPQNFEKLASAAQAAAEAAAAASDAGTTQTSAATRVTAAVPAPKLPSGPTATTVARAATVKRALNLRKVNLMGVYGSSSDRRALVRLPSGKLAKVQIGDRVDGGRVTALSDSTLTYVKSGRSITLTIGG